MIYEQGGPFRGLSIYLEEDNLYAGGWNTDSGREDWLGDWVVVEGVSAGRWHHVVLTLDAAAPDPAFDHTKTLTSEWVHVNSGGVFKLAKRQIGMTRTTLF